MLFSSWCNHLQIEDKKGLVKMTQVHTDRIRVSTLCLHMTYFYRYAGQWRSQGRAKGAQAPPWFWSDPRQMSKFEVSPVCGEGLEFEMSTSPPWGRSWLCHCRCPIYILPVLCDYYTSQNSLHSPSSYGLRLQQTSYEISRFLLKSEAVGGRRV